MIKNCLVIMLLAFLAAKTNASLMHSVKILFEKYILHDLVVVFHSNDQENTRQIISDSIYFDPTSEIIKGLGAGSGQFAMKVFSTAIKPRTARKQRKDVDANAIVLIMSGQRDELLNFIETLRTLRLIGVDTKFFFFLRGTLTLLQMRDVVDLFWEKLKVWKMILIQWEVLGKVRFYARGKNVVSSNVEEIDINFFQLQEFNFSSYNLKVAVLSNPPLSFEPAVHLEYKEGTLIRLISMISRNLELNITYVEIPNLAQGRVTIVNGSYNGLFRLLHRQEADLILSDTIIFLSRIAAATPLPSTYQVEAVWCAPRNFHVNQLKIMTGAFSQGVWLPLTLSFISITLFFYLKNCYDQSGHPIEYVTFTIFAISLQKCLKSPDKFILQYRLLFGMVLLFFLLISTCYLSGLLILVKFPPLPKQIETLQQAYDEGFIIYFQPYAVQWVNTSEHDLWNKLLQPGKHVYEGNYTKIVEKVIVEKSGIGLGDVFGCNMQADKVILNGNRLIHFLPDNFFLYGSSAFTSPANPIEPHLTDAFFRIIEGGFHREWEKIITHQIRLEATTKLKKFGVFEDENAKKPLTLHQLVGFFNIFVVLSIFCCIALGIEFLVSKCYI